MFALPWSLVRQAFETNWIALNVARGLSFPRNSIYFQLPLQNNTALSGDCHVTWLMNILAHNSGTAPISTFAWAAVLACSPMQVSMSRALLPQNIALATIAIQTQPDSADAYFWAAKSITHATSWGQVASDDISRNLAISYYRQGLNLYPDQGLAWRELGDLLTEENPQEALEAYLQSCFNGDPGSNGCWRAGLLAESSGNPGLAIQYYGYSHWSGALDRASYLQKQLQSNSAP